jgi:hypothetical protein
MVLRRSLLGWEDTNAIDAQRRLAQFLSQSIGNTIVIDPARFLAVQGPREATWYTSPALY